MPAPLQARALVAATVTAGAAVLSTALFEINARSLVTLALLAAAVVATELFQVDGDGDSLEPADAHTFSFSSAVHLAAVLIAGPWAGAAIAAFGVLTVDRVRGRSWDRVCFNASVFALAAVAGGFAFEALGGTPGALHLPSDFAACLALALVYSIVNTGLVSMIVAFSSGTSMEPFVLASIRSEFSTATAEAGLGVAVATFALTSPWGIIALAPLLVVVYQAHARLALLRRETAHALETFANVVDERDPSTFEHSSRVAEYVRDLAERLGFPLAEVARLRWAGRLHDLGKIAVDASVLRKPGQLDAAEREALTRHPRLSSRLLRRFRFAAEEARAVEYHHERFDGHGYYGIGASDQPLAAHFLVVADSFDAMTSDRPYRRGLPREQALLEIEREAGAQFHPIIAKAFVAAQRGCDPVAALAPAERKELERLRLQRRRVRQHRIAARPEAVTLCGLIGSLLGFAVGGPLWLVPGAFAVALGIGVAKGQELRGRRISADLAAILATPNERDAGFGAVVGRLSGACELRWAATIAWRGDELCAEVEHERRLSQDAPSEAALTSWLVREAETGGELLTVRGAELGSEGIFVALPLAREGSARTLLVLALGRPLSRSLDFALRSSVGALSSALAPRGKLRQLPQRKVASA